MHEDAVIDDTTPVERVVLLGVTWLDTREETPARLDEIRAICNDKLASVTGRLSEADTASALNSLSAATLVDEETRESESPVGKGRPAYSLLVDAETALETLEADDRLEALVRTVRQE